MIVDRTGLAAVEDWLTVAGLLLETVAVVMIPGIPTDNLRKLWLNPTGKPKLALLQMQVPD